MTDTKRIVLNTLAQHFRSVINTILVLYSTRLVLQALGVEDFGLYSLVGGVIMMLGFVTNAMLVTTQRNLAYSYTKSDNRSTLILFSNCIILHVALAILLAGMLLLIEPYIFVSSVLNILSHRMDAAKTVYEIMILSIVFSILSSPYRGAIFAREKIVYISIIDIVDGILKLLLAIWLTQAQCDRLLCYTWLMCGIIVFNLIAFALYAMKSFSECRALPSFKTFDLKIQKSLMGFSAWTLYSTGCIVGRTQGMAIIFNRFFGTAVNAAYGIAMQVQNAVQFVAQAAVNAMMPQIVKAEGRDDRQRMLDMSTMLSRYAFLLITMIVVPLCVEMNDVLLEWLGGNVPHYTSLMCIGVLIASAIDQTTVGLGVANQAIGRIRNYSLCINTIKLLTLPVAFVVLALGKGVVAAMFIYVLFELVCAISRIPFLKMTAGLKIKSYCADTLPYFIIPLIVEIFVSLSVVYCFHFRFRFVATVALCCIIALPTILFFGLKKHERNYVLNYINKKCE